jgi:protein O-mannosyl-transferase
MESSFVSLELYFEHRNYLPLLGIAAGVGYSVLNAPEHWRRAAMVLLLGWLAIAAFVTHSQAKVWGNEVLLSEIWAAEHPRSDRAVQVRSKVRYERGDTEGARQIFQDAAARGQGDDNAQLYLLLLDCYGRDATTPQALSRAASELRHDFPDFGTFDQLATLRVRATKNTCRGFGLAEWLTLTDAALANPRGHARYLVHYERALAYQSLRNLDGTVSELGRPRPRYPHATIQGMADAAPKA